MESIVLNELGHDGMRRIKIVSDVPVMADRFDRFERLIPPAAREKAVYEEKPDSLLNIVSLTIRFPVYGPYEVFYPSPKKFRRFMFVHFDYASRVSECIKLARDAFLSGTSYPPMYAYVTTLPNGADEFMTVHGCELFAVDWMPSNCVAVGGCDVG
jgi:hypothetical protein